MGTWLTKLCPLPRHLTIRAVPLPTKESLPLSRVSRPVTLRRCLALVFRERSLPRTLVLHLAPTEETSCRLLPLLPLTILVRAPPLVVRVRRRPPYLSPRSLSPLAPLPPRPPSPSPTLLSLVICPCRLPLNWPTPVPCLLPVPPPYLLKLSTLRRHRCLNRLSLHLTRSTTVPRLPTRGRHPCPNRLRNLLSLARRCRTVVATLLRCPLLPLPLMTQLLTDPTGWRTSLRPTETLQNEPFFLTATRGKSFCRYKTSLLYSPLTPLLYFPPPLPS